MRRGHARFLVAVVVLSLTVAACGGGTTGGGKKGGNLIVAAEQFPDCLNVIDTCSNASWLHWVVTELVLPKAMTLDAQGNFVASATLVEAPTLENGGLKQNPFTITYKIKPEAVWDDGSPITSEDLEFTRQAVLKTKGSLSSLGYDKITKIDTSDPKTAVITFSEIYADWPDLFGGSSTNGYILKKGAFPKGADTAGTMQSEIGFSGNAWTLESFTKDQQLVLKPNARWWGDKPIVDQLTVVAREEQSSELNSLFTGEIFAIYPQPAGGNLGQQLQGKAGVKATFGSGTTYEGLWINHDSPPMNEVAVRQAFAYSVDRQSIVDTIVKPDNPDAAVLNCAGWVPNVGEWCDNTDYAKYTYDPAKARGLLTGAGWTCPASGTCTKAGKKLAVTIHTTAGNKGRADTLAIVQEKAKAAGFEITIKTLASPSPIFTDFLPKRQHTVALFANVASPDPSVTSFLAADQIPAADGSGGQNWSGWRNAAATTALHDADKQLDPAKRKELLQKVGDFEAEELPWLPLFQKPLITAWRDDKIGGPVDAYTSSPLGPFYNANLWFLK